MQSWHSYLNSVTPILLARNETQPDSSFCQGLLRCAYPVVIDSCLWQYVGNRDLQAAKICLIMARRKNILTGEKKSN
ncbi:unknown protein [Microcystis aeruginosa NIES-843]|uniref:Uncharacterized protein n=1 Tax=Microcystis aeruginosa (strain NIES-843 / IAM M-2473) TaxID=449447 RepID=B0JIS1_MICAN|nr:unknown protein [Microcystis aeruginosa NIES-843]